MVTLWNVLLSFTATSLTIFLIKAAKVSLIILDLIIYSSLRIPALAMKLVMKIESSLRRILNL